MNIVGKSVQLPKHRPRDVYNEAMGDTEPREKFNYAVPRVALILPTSKYANRSEAGREGKRRLGDKYARCRFFWTARFWVFHSYE